MAIYHSSGKPISRAGVRAATAASVGISLMNVRLMLMAFTLLMPTSVPASGSERQPNESAVVVIEAGEGSGIRHTAIIHARNAEEFAELWAQHASINMPPSPAPQHETDFERREVLGIFLGSRPTGGFSMRVASVHVVSGKVRIHLEERFPADDCVVTSAVTQLFAIVEVPTLPRHPTFELVVDRQAGPSCE